MRQHSVHALEELYGSLNPAIPDDPYALVALPGSLPDDPTSATESEKLSAFVSPMGSEWSGGVSVQAAAERTELGFHGVVPCGHREGNFKKHRSHLIGRIAQRASHVATSAWSHARMVGRTTPLVYQRASVARLQAWVETQVIRSHGYEWYP